MLASSLHSSTRGERNRNPGNLRESRPGAWRLWPGAVGVDDTEHIIFRQEIDGIRAMVINLRAYRWKHGIRTPWGIVRRWTKNPKTDDAYVQTVCKYIGGGHGQVDDHQRLDFGNAKTLERICRAIAYYENGKDPCSEQAWETVFPHVVRRRGGVLASSRWTRYNGRWHFVDNLADQNYSLGSR